MIIELTITVKDEEKKKLSKSFLIYESFQMKADDPILDQYVKELLAEFKGTPDDIQVKATMVLK